jgi:UDP-GlcNAc:undecaprenyl-phosphate GlcNAc-1-phosphate transferase
MIDQQIFIYSILSLISILISIITYKKLKILDFPEKRKIHKNPVPLSGGFAAYLSITILIIYVFSYLSSFTSVIFFFYLTVSSLYFLGLADDLYQINATKRIFIAIIIYLIFLTQDIFVVDDNFFLIDIIYIDILEMSLKLNIFQSIILTIFCILSFQNAMNMIDGINGLSALIFMIINLFIWLYSLESDYLEFNKALLIFLSIFFLFNIRSNLFFGESGIYLVTFLTSLLLIFSYKKNLISFEQIILLLLIPGLDMTRVTLTRLKNKIKISTADKSHLHHLIIKKYNNVFTLLIFLILIFPLNLISYYFPDYSSYLILITVLTYIYTYIIFKN